MCREAVVEHDPIVDSMWILLSELIDAHNRLPRDCIFKYATKPSTRKTALAFMQLVPMFALRLKQRDFDYLLVKPKLRRYAGSGMVHACHLAISSSQSLL